MQWRRPRHRLLVITAVAGDPHTADRLATLQGIRVKVGFDEAAVRVGFSLERYRDGDIAIHLKGVKH